MKFKIDHPKLAECTQEWIYQGKSTGAQPYEGALAIGKNHWEVKLKSKYGHFSNILTYDKVVPDPYIVGKSEFKLEYVCIDLKKGIYQISTIYPDFSKLDHVEWYLNGTILEEKTNQIQLTLPEYDKLYNISARYYTIHQTPSDIVSVTITRKDPLKADFSIGVSQPTKDKVMFYQFDFLYKGDDISVVDEIEWTIDDTKIALSNKTITNDFTIAGSHKIALRFRVDSNWSNIKSTIVNIIDPAIIDFNIKSELKDFKTHQYLYSLDYKGDLKEITKTLWTIDGVTREIAGTELLQNYDQYGTHTVTVKYLTHHNTWSVVKSINTVVASPMDTPFSIKVSQPDAVNKTLNYLFEFVYEGDPSLIEKVEWYIDNNLLAKETGKSLNYQFDTVGNHSISARFCIGENWSTRKSVSITAKDPAIIDFNIKSELKDELTLSYNLNIDYKGDMNNIQKVEWILDTIISPDIKTSIIQNYNSFGEHQVKARYLSKNGSWSNYKNISIKIPDPRTVKPVWTQIGKTSVFLALRLTYRYMNMVVDKEVVDKDGVVLHELKEIKGEEGNLVYYSCCGSSCLSNTYKARFKVKMGSMEFWSDWGVYSWQKDNFYSPILWKTAAEQSNQIQLTLDNLMDGATMGGGGNGWDYQRTTIDYYPRPINPGLERSWTAVRTNPHWSVVAPYVYERYFITSMDQLLNYRNYGWFRYNITSSTINNYSLQAIVNNSALLMSQSGGAFDHNYVKKNRRYHSTANYARLFNSGYLDLNANSMSYQIGIEPFVQCDINCINKVTGQNAWKAGRVVSNTITLPKDVMYRMGREYDPKSYAMSMKSPTLGSVKENYIFSEIITQNTGSQWEVGGARLQLREATNYNFPNFTLTPTDFGLNMYYNDKPFSYRVKQAFSTSDYVFAGFSFFLTYTNGVRYAGAIYFSLDVLSYMEQNCQNDY